MNMDEPIDETTYWQRFLPDDSPVPAGEPPASCDIAIVGGGFTGLAAAIHLAKSGADVAVFDRDRLGWGASTRNGGQTLAGLKLSPGQLVKKFGRAKAQQFYKTTLDAIDYLEAFLQEEEIDCDFKRYGGLWAAFTPGHFEAFTESQTLLRETFSHETHLVDRANLATELGTEYYHGALIDPLSGGLNAGKYILGLINTALKYNVRLYENTEIVDIRRDGDGFQIATNDRQIAVKNVAIATNGYTPDFLSDLRRRIIPIGSYIIATEPLDPAVASSLIPRGRMVFDTKKYLNYFRITEDNRMLFGGRASVTEISPQQSGPILHRNMVEIFPQLAKAKIENSWRGYVGFTFDQMPHIGERDGMYYSMGFCGHGVANGFYFGRQLALLMQGQLQDCPFVDLKFPTMPFYRKKPWFLPIASAAYRLADRLAR
jgi:glycine/D-amino acid oxidase-like deaminating enzyme